MRMALRQQLLFIDGRKTRKNAFIIYDPKSIDSTVEKFLGQ